MSKFSGYLDLTCFGIADGYRINENYDYYNRAAMIVATLMEAGMSLFQRAEVENKCCHAGIAKADAQKACKIMNTIYSWKAIPEKRLPECATSWLDDAFCTLHKKYEEIVEKEIL